MGISIKVDLTGCNTVFLVPPGGYIDDFSIEAIQKIKSRGVGRIRTMTIVEASELYADTQQKHGGIPAGQMFLKLTPKGKVARLFW